MGIQQTFISIICVSFLLSCSGEKQDATIYNLETENQELKRQVKDRQNLLDNWFNDFASIQEEINTINTREAILLQLENSENQNMFDSDKDKLLTKIEKIRREIEIKEKQLSSIGYELEGALVLIKNLKKTLNEKEEIVKSLQVENNKIKEINKNLTVTTSTQAKTIVNQGKQIVSQQAEIKSKENELAKIEIETYFRLSKQLYSISNKLPEDIKRWSIKKSKRELEQLKLELYEEAQKYKTKGDSILNANKHIK